MDVNKSTKMYEDMIKDDVSNKDSDIESDNNVDIRTINTWSVLKTNAMKLRKQWMEEKTKESNKNTIKKENESKKARKKEKITNKRKKKLGKGT